MKICGITVINTPNYGTVLQAFALQEAVKKLGHEYAILNYYNEAQEKKFTFFGKTEYMGYKYWIAKKILYPFRKYQMCRILKFANEHMNYSRKIKSWSELMDVKNEYECFITGSDQVWNNQEISHFDDAYYLSFAEGENTLSYAASFGKTYSMLTEKDRDFYKKNLPQIRSIGVREESGKEIVEKLANKRAEYVCDPVFLLEAKEWDKYAHARKGGKDYLLVYLVGDGINFDVNKAIMKKAKSVAENRNLETKVVSIGLSAPLYGALGVPSVEEWLGLVRDASLVMTNAFHGVAFCIIFGKDFCCFVRGDENNRMNTRIFGLLKTLGLEDRIMSLDEKMNMDSIDYAKPTKLLKQFKLHSVEFLKNSIGGGIA